MYSLSHFLVAPFFFLSLIIPTQADLVAETLALFRPIDSGMRNQIDAFKSAVAVFDISIDKNECMRPSASNNLVRQPLGTMLLEPADTTLYAYMSWAENQTLAQIRSPSDITWMQRYEDISTACANEWAGCAQSNSCPGFCSTPQKFSNQMRSVELCFVSSMEFMVKEAFDRISEAYKDSSMLMLSYWGFTTVRGLFARYPFTTDPMKRAGMDFMFSQPAMVQVILSAHMAANPVTNPSRQTAVFLAPGMSPEISIVACVPVYIKSRYWGSCGIQTEAFFNVSQVWYDQSEASPDSFFLWVYDSDYKIMSVTDLAWVTLFGEVPSLTTKQTYPTLSSARVDTSRLMASASLCASRASQGETDKGCLIETMIGKKMYSAYILPNTFFNGFIIGMQPVQNSDRSWIYGLGVGVLMVLSFLMSRMVDEKKVF